VHFADASNPEAKFRSLPMGLLDTADQFATKLKQDKYYGKTKSGVPIYHWVETVNL
jgi:hypothetical protein